MRTGKLYPFQFYETVSVSQRHSALRSPQWNGTAARGNHDLLKHPNQDMHQPRISFHTEPDWGIAMGAPDDRLRELAERTAERLIESGANLLAPIGLHPMLFSFGTGDRTESVISAARRKATRWISDTLWKKGRESMRISLCDRSSIVTDIDAFATGMLKRWNLWHSASGWNRQARARRDAQERAPQSEVRRPDISIVRYADRYKTDFKRLNQTWITEHFELEEADRRMLDYPRESIIHPGGRILLALVKDRVVGACALLKLHDGVFDFELAKMAVDPRFRGQGIGRRLGEAIIEQARELGGKTIFLESNTILAPAIHLYGQLGFVETSRQPTPYSRGNIQMVLELQRSQDGDKKP